MFIMWAVIAGLVISGYFFARGTQSRSLENTMQLGMLIAALTGTIYFQCSPVFQIAIIIMAVMLFVQKGFV